MNERIEYLRKKAAALPLLPGVYIMKDKSGKIIYIGKAKKLKNRVSTYFNNSEKYIKVEKMVEHVFDFDYIICDSEYEALVLECAQIKEHSPKYNIMLKDDKGYSYLKITKEEWPRLFSVFQKDDKNAEYLGPYYSHYIIAETLDLAKTVYKLPECNKVFPKDFKKSRPCLNFYIGKCMGVCNGKTSKEAYLEAVNEAVKFIKGGKEQAIKKLTADMESAAENLQFEEAAKLRDRINALKKSVAKQKVIASSYKCEDVIASAVSENKICFTVFSFSDYTLKDCVQYVFDFYGERDNDTAEFIKQYYQNKPVPRRIVTDIKPADSTLLQRFLSEKEGAKVLIIVPQKGNELDLTKMALLNASEHLAKSLGRNSKETAALNELTGLLGLKKAPEIIEAYDISHMGGTNTVAGMTVFKNGLPLKSAYKRFNLKTVSGGDDYSALTEVLSRRMAEYENAETEDGFGILPSLILIDGGKGQVNAVKEIIAPYSIPLYGMVKDGKHRTRALTDGNGEIAIKPTKAVFNLITAIQDETHRFAISFERKKHVKKSLTSSLTEIDGVGNERAKKLLRKFKTVTAIKNANVKELSAVVPENIAQNIYNFFN